LQNSHAMKKGKEKKGGELPLLFTFWVGVEGKKGGGSLGKNNVEKKRFQRVIVIVHKKKRRKGDR